MLLTNGNLLFSQEKKEEYSKKKNACINGIEKFTKLLNTNKAITTSMHQEQLNIKELIRRYNANLEYLDCALACCLYHECDHIFAFIDSNYRNSGLPCFCLKCGLSLNSAVFPNYKKYTPTQYSVPSTYYLNKIGINYDNVGDYIALFKSVGYLPVSKSYLLLRYKRIKEAFPDVSDDEIVTLLIKTVTEEKQLVR